MKMLFATLACNDIESFTEILYSLTIPAYA